MKKNKTTDREQKRNPRHLSLNRETIRILDDPALLKFARGGFSDPPVCDNNQESTSGSNC